MKRKEFEVKSHYKNKLHIIKIFLNLIEFFDNFNCKEPRSIGINMKSLTKIFNMAKKDYGRFFSEPYPDGHNFYRYVNSM